MVNRNLMREFDVPETEFREAIDAAFGDSEVDWLPADGQDFREGRVVTGRVRRVTSDNVWVDVGQKSEGAVELREWYDDILGHVVPPKAGDDVAVLLEAAEDENGVIVLSHRKAKRQKQWEELISKVKEGDTVSGPVVRKIKGGLLVNIGVGAFLPASQTDIRRVPDLGILVGQTIQCKILTIDEGRRNILVSRRRFIEEERASLKQNLLKEIEVGQIRKGIVKNLVAFGAFIDLGGIDGLLHVTDISWGRTADPSSILKTDQQLDVYVLKVDREREKIALSLKHTTPNPWANVAAKYPVNSRHTGEVVNVMNYGAFVKLEPGVEGLVHISEMSWTKRLNHPSEMVAQGDQLEVQVLSVNNEKQEISLGIKQTQADPWDTIAERFPKDSVVTGVVRNLTNYGAFIALDEGVDGLLHVGDMSWTRKVAHPSELVAKGDTLTCKVLDLDSARKRIALGLKQMHTDPWAGDIVERYKPGEIKRGKVTKLATFGVFVELETGVEGLLHISELADQSPESPDGVVKVGEEIDVRVLRVDVEARKIGLSRRDGQTPVEDAEAAKSADTSRTELRGGTGSNTGELFAMPPTSEESGSAN